MNSSWQGKWLNRIKVYAQLGTVQTSEYILHYQVKAGSPENTVSLSPKNPWPIVGPTKENAREERSTYNPNLQHFHIKWLISMLEPAHSHSTAPDFYHCNWKWLLKVIQYNSLNKKLKGKLHQPPLRFHKMTIPPSPLF